MSAGIDSHNKHLLLQLPEILTNIQANWPVLPSGIWNGSGVRSVLRHLQEMSRKCRQAGLVNINELIQIIDQAIDDVYQEDAQPDPEEVDRLNQLLARLNRAVSASQASYDEQADSDTSYDLIFLHQNNSVDDQITGAIKKNGWRALNLDHVESLHSALTDEMVKVVLIDTEYLRVTGEMNQLLDEMGTQKQRRPELIFLSDQCDIEERLEVLRAGATQFFSRPVNINDLMLSIKQTLSPQLKPYSRILIVEDDESQAKFASTLLRKGGFETLMVTDPLKVIEAVDQFQPDLILMDLYMPGANGIELTQVIRERDESLTIPIVFLSGEDDLDKKILALHHGADDFLTKPVRPQHLSATVKTRINRAKEIFVAGTKGHIDQTTGLRNRREFLQQLNLGTQVMQKEGTVCALISITLADPEQPHRNNENDEFDNVVLDIADLAVSLFSKRDIIARTAMHNLGILVLRKTKGEIEKLGATLYEQLRDALTGETVAGYEVKFGISLELIGSDQLDTYLYLTHAEAASLQAYREKSDGLTSYQHQSATPDSRVETSDEFQKQQFLNALKAGLIEFREQRLTACHDMGKEIREQIVVPAPATDIRLISNDIYLTAEQHGLSNQLDRYVCQSAIKILGEFALKGDATQLIVRISSHATRDDSMLEFLRSELRRLQLVGTGLMIEFNLPSLASNLKQARHFLGELSAMGIATLLGNFSCNDTAYKVLAYLNADGVRPHISLMQENHERVQEIAAHVHSLHAKIILPEVEKFGQISLHWSEAADYVQADYSDYY
jgi:DNA-binding response OmpR family regulator/EAL domain-containing protein (putative c-di-GMP-specific phosphodiesterase class I)